MARRDFLKTSAPRNHSLILDECKFPSQEPHFSQNERARGQKSSLKEKMHKHERTETVISEKLNQIVTLKEEREG